MLFLSPKNADAKPRRRPELCGVHGLAFTDPQMFVNVHEVIDVGTARFLYLTERPSGFPIQSVWKVQDGKIHRLEGLEESLADKLRQDVCKP